MPQSQQRWFEDHLGFLVFHRTGTGAGQGRNWDGYAGGKSVWGRESGSSVWGNLGDARATWHSHDGRLHDGTGMPCSGQPIDQAHLFTKLRVVSQSSASIRCSPSSSGTICAKGDFHQSHRPCERSFLGLETHVPQKRQQTNGYSSPFATCVVIILTTCSSLSSRIRSSSALILSFIFTLINQSAALGPNPSLCPASCNSWADG